MAGITIQDGVKASSLSIVVTRANGRVERRGIVAYSNRNPIIHRAVNAWIWLKERWWEFRA